MASARADAEREGADTPNGTRDGDAAGGESGPALPFPACSGSLLTHLQKKGWEEGAFSDVTVVAFGCEYALHRLVLCRAPYFDAVLGERWQQKPADGADGAALRVELNIDDPNVDADAVKAALGYLYGVQPSLEPTAALPLLAAAAFLGLEKLCARCTESIVSDVSEDTVVGYVHFAEENHYGEHGENVRQACWGYLCRGASVELRALLPSLPLQTLVRLLASDELWVPSEHDRYELVLEVLRQRRANLAETLQAHSESAGAPSEVGDELRGAEEKELEAARQLLGEKSGAVAFSHMTHDQLLGVRIEVDEEGLPHDAVSDGLWEQTALRSRVEACAAQGYEKDRPNVQASEASASADAAAEALFKLRVAGGDGDAAGNDADGGSGGLPRPASPRSGGSGDGTGGDRPKMVKSPSGGLGRSLSAMPSGSTLGGVPRGAAPRPLSAFPPFRFSVEFSNVRSVTNGQSQHSEEVFYAGSLWKVSVQAFNDEDPHSRRTLGLFLHRRCPVESAPAQGSPGGGHAHGQGHGHGRGGRAVGGASSSGGASAAAGGQMPVPYVDTRERVYARYQLICPAAGSLMVLGSIQPDSKETHLPKAPKGWGWRTALLFEELEQFLFLTPEGTLRVVAVVQLC